MKKYNLSAEFVKWQGTAESSTEKDAFDYVIEFDSEEEAKVRLESLIIDKMSSRPGWSYQLLDSKISPFPVTEVEESSLAINEQPSVSDEPEPSEQSNLPNTEILDNNTSPEEVSL